MLVDDKIYLGTSTRPEYLALKYGNRHGLVTGATGTGKTVSLQIMAEGFSRAGVPVFCADVKGALLGLEQQGRDNFFGEKALVIADLMRIAPDGRGYISVLAADQLMQSPQLYATFLLWLMSELFEALPEVGNPDKPKLVFF